VPLAKQLKQPQMTGTHDNCSNGAARNADKEQKQQNISTVQLSLYVTDYFFKRHF